MTILLVLVIIFSLDQLAPGDRVVHYLELEGISADRRIEQYMRSYDHKARELGYDLPVFYFSLVPNYMPSNLHQIYPLTRRLAIKKISCAIKSRTLAEQYLHLTSIALQQDSVSNELWRVLNQMVVQDNVVELSSFALKMAPLVQNDQYPWNELFELIPRMTPSNQAITIPAITWNGSANRFHHFFAQITRTESRVSIIDGRPAIDKIGQALSWTASIGMIVLILSLFSSIVMACLMMYYKQSPIARYMEVVIFGVTSMPLFWIATLGLVFLTTDYYAEWMHIFPSLGVIYSSAVASFWDTFTMHLSQLLLPILVITLPTSAYLTKVLFNDMKHLHQRPYVVAARARGIDEWKILISYVLPNALLSFITLFCGALPSIVSGSVIVELVFNIPGIGRLLMVSVQRGDWPVILPIVVITAIITIFAYVLSDILTYILFPRTQTQLYHA